MKRKHQDLTATERLLGLPSDGLLPAYTQQIGDTYKVNHANHIEVTDMSNSSQGDITRQRFDQIWERSDIFHTEEREQ